MELSNQKTGSEERSTITEHTLRGEIRRVVYENPEGSYSVLKIVDLQGVEHTVVGPVTGSHEGQGIEVTGVWEFHKEHGRRFKVNTCRFILPTTNEGIVRYLSSGIIKGIGKKTAEAIVDTFGGKTLEILDRYSSRLTEVPGFGKKRLEMVRKAWREQAEKRDIFIFLQGLGISLAYCHKIYKTYGDTAPEIVKENPYRLANDVDGIGFILADRIASSLGIGKNDEQRLAAGICYALNQINLNGHVCYPETEFLDYAANLLEVSREEVLIGIEKAQDAAYIVIDPCEFVRKDLRTRMVYSKKMWSVENELANLINSLTSVKYHKAGRIRQQYTPSIALNQEQAAAVGRVRSFPFSIITGGPGVGKTTVVGEIVKMALKADLKVYLAAPTGRAAQRLGESCRKTAMTIHRLLKWEPANQRFVYGYRHRLPCDLLIVDEVSMLDLELALFLFRAVTPGTTIVLVGDADQLPSVGPGSFLHDLINSRKCASTHLSKIYRQQSGSKIILSAHEVNAGKIPDLSPVPKNTVSDFYWIEQEDPEQIIQTITKMVQERIPNRFGLNPMRDIQVLTPMNRGSCGTQRLNEILQQKLNPGHKPQFKVGERVYKSGDQVMQIKNNYDKNVFNGDMGRIVNIDMHEQIFKVAFENRTVEYDFVESDQLTLSYAVTIHKSQGSEFPAVIVPVINQHYIMLRRNLVYTAMTRARKLLVLIGTKKAVKIAVSNYHIETRYSMLLQRLLALS